MFSGPQFFRVRIRFVLILLVVFCLCGCVSRDNPQDPFEPMNRAIFRLNMFLNDVLLVPAATVYRDAVPQFWKNRVSDGLATLRMPLSGIFYFLRNDRENTARSFVSFITNATFGFFGLFNVAQKIGIAPKRSIDGDDLIKSYGGRPGPYVMLPILGPTTLRGAMGKIMAFLDPCYISVNDVRFRNQLWIGEYALGAVSSKAEIMDLEKDMRKNSPDFYVTVRSVYMQKANEGQEPEEQIELDEGDL